MRPPRTPAPTAAWRENLEDRRRGMAMFAADLATTGEVLVSQERAADVLWLARDIRDCDWLVRERGWAVERFDRWFVDSVTAVFGTSD